MHLRVADGTTFFCSSKEEFFILNYIVQLFEATSGLKINRSKCQVLDINCDDDKLSR